MGQYYHILNEDKEEYIVPPMLKMWEIMNNPTAGMLAYLTADAPYDGGGTPTANYRRFKDDDGDVDWDQYNKANEIVWPNFGRWSGDRIRTVGDYAESGLYEEASESSIWDEITDEVLPEIRAAKDDTMGRGGIRLGNFGPIGKETRFRVKQDANHPMKFYGEVDVGGWEQTSLHDTPKEAKEAAKSLWESQAQVQTQQSTPAVA